MGIANAIEEQFSPASKRKTTDRHESEPPELGLKCEPRIVIINPSRAPSEITKQPQQSYRPLGAQAATVEWPDSLSLFLSAFVTRLACFRLFVFCPFFPHHIFASARGSDKDARHQNDKGAYAERNSAAIDLLPSRLGIPESARNQAASSYSFPLLFLVCFLFFFFLS